MLGKNDYMQKIPTHMLNGGYGTLLNSPLFYKIDF
jgi:hypothetical protein